MTAIRLLSVILLVSASCSASASKYYINPAPDPELSLIHSPELDIEAGIDVGDSIILTSLQGTRPGRILKTTISEFPIRVSFLKYYLTLPPGRLALGGSIPEGALYMAERYELKGVGESWGGGIFIPSQPDQPVEICIREKQGTYTVCEPTDLIDVASLKQTTIEVMHDTSFRRELVFTGVSKNVISVLYREFLRDFARPAFSQELHYDLAEGDVIGYKGGRFQVIKASNTGLRYKVLRHLN